MYCEKKESIIRKVGAFTLPSEANQITEVLTKWKYLFIKRVNYLNSLLFFKVKDSTFLSFPLSRLVLVGRKKVIANQNSKKLNKPIIQASLVKSFNRIRYLDIYTTDLPSKKLHILYPQR